MALKAIKITEGNQDMLGSRYGIEKEDYVDTIPIGMHLVTDFGNDETFDVVSSILYSTRFVEVEDIENGFKAVEYVT